MMWQAGVLIHIRTLVYTQHTPPTAAQRCVLVTAKNCVRRCTRKRCSDAHSSVVVAQISINTPASDVVGVSFIHSSPMLYGAKTGCRGVACAQYKTRWGTLPVTSAALRLGTYVSGAGDGVGLEVAPHDRGIHVNTVSFEQRLQYVAGHLQTWSGMAHRPRKTHGIHSIALRMPNTNSRDAAREREHAGGEGSITKDKGLPHILQNTAVPCRDRSLRG